MFPHLCVQNNDDARPTYATGVAAGARVYRERRRAVGRWWWRALIIPRHAIAIRELPNQPRVWLGRQWCSIIRFASRALHTQQHTHTHTHTRARARICIYVCICIYDAHVLRTQIHTAQTFTRAQALCALGRVNLNT